MTESPASSWASRRATAGRGFVRVDDSGDDFELPGGKAGEMGGEATLLDQYKRVALRVIEQDRRRVVTKKDLARQLRAPAPA